MGAWAQNRFWFKNYQAIRYKTCMVAERTQVRSDSCTHSIPLPSRLLAFYLSRAQPCRRKHSFLPSRKTWPCNRSSNISQPWWQQELHWDGSFYQSVSTACAWLGMLGTESKAAGTKSRAKTSWTCQRTSPRPCSSSNSSCSSSRLLLIEQWRRMRMVFDDSNRVTRGRSSAGVRGSQWCCWVLSVWTTTTQQSRPYDQYDYQYQNRWPDGAMQTA